MFHVKHSVFFTPRVPTHREQPRPTGARTPQEPEHREKPHNVQRETRAGAQRATQAGAQRASVSRETLRLFHPAGAHSPQVAAFRGCPSDMGMFHVKHSFSSGAIADNAQRDALTPAKEKAAWFKTTPPLAPPLAGGGSPPRPPPPRFERSKEGGGFARTPPLFFAPGFSWRPARRSRAGISSHQDRAARLIACLRTARRTFLPVTR